MPKKTIVTCSGGLDSIGLLWKLLHETDEEILVQHIRFKCFWIHWEAEEIAFLRCMEYIKAHSRPFTILPIMDYRSKGIAPYRPVGGFCGAIAALEHNADRVVRGTVKIDMESRNRSPIWTNLDHVMVQVIDVLTKDTNIVFERPAESTDKRDWFALMPEELTDMVISCTNPVMKNDEWDNCGTCHSCRRFAEGKSGVTPTHGDSWVREFLEYKRPLEIRRLYGKPTAMHFIEPSVENITHLWHLLTKTDINVLVQPIIIGDSTKKTSEMTDIIEYLKANARDFILMHPTRFIIPCTPNYRRNELAKAFCIGNLTRVYRDHVTDIAITFPSDPLLKEECKGLLDKYYFGKDIKMDDTMNASGGLPSDLLDLVKKEICNA